MVKIERSFPAPASLLIEAKKKSGSYEKTDVIEQLRKDFHDKCYICEMKELQDPQVEHLRPHKNGRYPERKFDWTNLFWSCGHCNNIKNQSKYETGIIDCCQQDPEELLVFLLKNGQIEIDVKDPDDGYSVRTAELVYESFNLTNTGMRTYASDLRYKKLSQEMNVLYDCLEEYRKHPASKIVLRKLKALLRRESAFAAFKRCYVRENIHAFPKLEKYLG